MSAQRQRPIDFATEGLLLAHHVCRNCGIRIELGRPALHLFSLLARSAFGKLRSVSKFFARLIFGKYDETSTYRVGGRFSSRLSTWLCRRELDDARKRSRLWRARRRRRRWNHRATVGHPGAGAAIGGALGLGAGALVGDLLQGQEIKQGDQQRQMDANQAEIERQRREIERLRKQGEY
jgi:hypothetical protein